MRVDRCVITAHSWLGAPGTTFVNFKSVSTKNTLNLREYSKFWGTERWRTDGNSEPEQQQTTEYKSSDLSKFAAWLKVRLENAGYSLPGWVETENSAGQIQPITSDEKPRRPLIVIKDGMAVKRVTGPSTVVRKRNGKMNATLVSLTDYKGSEDESKHLEEKNTDEEEEVQATKKLKKKPAATDSTTELLIPLVKTVEKLQQKLERMSFDKAKRGTIAMLNLRAGTEERNQLREKWDHSFRKKKRRVFSSSKDENHATSSNELIAAQ